MRFGVWQCFILTLGVLAGLPSGADTNVSVDIGWGERTRPGAWTPVFITVSDPKPRNAIAELRAPHDMRTAMVIDQPIAISSSPQTYVIYAPLVNSWSEPISLKIRDLATGKSLYDEPLLDQSNSDAPHHGLFNVRNNSGLFFGVSGRAPAMMQLEAGTDHAPTFGFLRESRLPRIARGYDPLQVLVLNQPDFTALESEQQIAIGDWVRAGGRLVLWPSENPIPAGGPLIDLLPCRVGEVTTVTLSKKDLKDAGLADRFGKFKARVLTPTGNSISIPLLGKSGALANRGHRGFGTVTVINFDASGLDFNSTLDAERFWGSIVDLSTHTKSSGSDQPQNSNGLQIQEQKRSEAAGQIIDLLGDVPGVGAFGFKYVAMVLLGMMVIVGPVDWFVLKWLGRQPWTWVTTLGWIGLITTGAISIGSIFRSGDLHYRTLQVIDQAEGAVVARTDVIGIYSPKNDDYQLDATAGSWWEPISTDQFNYGGGMMKSIAFQQDARSNLPGEMSINVWSLRFLSGETIGKTEAVIATSLVIEPGTNTITGTITNLGQSPLTHLWLRTQYGTEDLTEQSGFPAGGLASKATLHISTSIKKPDAVDVWNTAAPNPPSYGNYGQHSASKPADAFAIVRAAGDLSSLRSERINRLMSKVSPAPVGTIYGLCETPASAVKLPGHDAHEKHWQVIRALVPLKNSQSLN